MLRPRKGVAGQIADRVYAIERHRSLGESARDRLQELGYDNIDLRVGDGTKDWPEAAPSDVILVQRVDRRCRGH